MFHKSALRLIIITFLVGGIKAPAHAAFSADELLRRISHPAQTHQAWYDNISWLRENKDGIRVSLIIDKFLCQKLTQLDATQLLDLYSLYLTDQSEPEDCIKILKNKVEEFLRRKKQALRLTVAARTQSIEPCESAASRATFGPTENYYIDPRKNSGPLVGNSFKKCFLNFTFDDGPNESLTPELLKLLKKHEVYSNFFVVGDNVHRHPEVVMATAAAGHEIGNHTESHRQLDKLKFTDGVKEIETGFSSIFDVLQAHSPFFRFPFGASTKDLRSYLKKTSKTEFFWRIDTLDWKIKDPEALFHFVLKEIEREKQGIILFHDIQPQTITTMEFIFTALRDAGYYPVVVRPEVF